LFSGIFFPITSMPGWVQAIAQISPLTRGASLIRSLTLDQGIGVSALISLAYLSIWFVVGVWLTIRAFRKMLIV
jgi:lipooligosaccharide transport system permease protein